MTPLKTLRLSRPVPGRDDIFLQFSVLQTLEVLDGGAGGLAESPRARMTSFKNGIENLRIAAVIELRIIVFFVLRNSYHKASPTGMRMRTPRGPKSRVGDQTGHDWNISVATLAQAILAQTILRK